MEYKGGMTMKPEELSSLFASLSADDQERLSKIVTDFVAASSDPDVVPMLLNVPKSALESGNGMLRLPVSVLSEETKNMRRATGVEHNRNYRARMSETERAEYLANEAARKRLVRARKKAQSSDPSP